MTHFPYLPGSGLPSAKPISPAPEPISAPLVVLYGHDYASQTIIGMDPAKPNTDLTSVLVWYRTADGLTTLQARYLTTPASTSLSSRLRHYGASFKPLWQLAMSARPKALLILLVALILYWGKHYARM